MTNSNYYERLEGRVDHREQVAMQHLPERYREQLMFILQHTLTHKKELGGLFSRQIVNICLAIGGGSILLVTLFSEEVITSPCLLYVSWSLLALSLVAVLVGTNMEEAAVTARGNAVLALLEEPTNYAEAKRLQNRSGRTNLAAAVLAYAAIGLLLLGLVFFGIFVMRNVG